MVEKMLNEVPDSTSIVSEAVNSELSRRSFVKATAATLAVAAAAGTLSSLVGCGGQGGVLGVGNSKVYTSVCRFCGCGCGVLCEVAGGRLVSVTGDPDNASNKGLNCVKGYYLAKVLYGKDRLTKPLIRKDKATKGTDSGLTEASWDEALDLVAEKLKAVWKEDKSRLAFWASGQQPIVEGYLTAKFWKAGLLSNNIDPNARLCMASAVVAFMNVFQTDEPAGCYEDLDLADVFITWGANMAEAHPVLYSRLTARKLNDANVKHYDLGTIKTRTSASANKTMLFKPGTDNAIANCIANYLVSEEKYDKKFVEAHCQFKAGTEDLGNAYEDGWDATDKLQEATGNDGVWGIEFSEYADMLKKYTFKYTSELSGVSEADLKELAEVFADKDKKVMSLWTMGVNQHNRGTWMNHNIYNIHLLSGKFAQPGCGPFSLTGQPTACGTAREVGTFAHRLPADLLVANGQHRRYTEVLWGLPEGYLGTGDDNPGISKPGKHTIKIFRDLSNGDIDFLWSAHNNWAGSLPNLTRFLGKGEKTGIMDAFIVVSEVYPTLSCDYADVVFPAAMWIEREGQFGNAERRTAIFEKAVDPPGDAQWDAWILMQVAQRVLDGEVIGGNDSFDTLFGTIWDKDKKDFINADQRETSKIVWEEYRTFTNPTMNPTADDINNDVGDKFGVTADDGTYTPSKLKLFAKQMAPYEEYLNNHGLTWPVREVDGKWLGTKWRFASGKQEDGFDEYGIAQYGQKDEGGKLISKPGNIDLYKTAKYKASVTFRPYEPPAENPDAEYPFWFCTGRLLEHWHTGSMTRVVPELDRALPEALLDMNEADCEKIGVKDGDMVTVKSRHGEFNIRVSTAGRTAPPAGVVFAPFFAKETLINLAVHDYYDPLSKEPDYKKTCVSITKA
ncbi:MAG: molybdopterin-dependent oxidoreductase [Coriobacteriales bacterium]|jgi:nitrate reductase NapA|nr:molybdopterin-dependent oxidoreductase [Coriobacteriales bacterium]